MPNLHVEVFYGLRKGLFAMWRPRKFAVFRLSKEKNWVKPDPVSCLDCIKIKSTVNLIAAVTIAILSSE